MLCCVVMLCGVVVYDIMCHAVVWCATLRFGIEWYIVVCCGVVWCAGSCTDVV